MPATSSVVGSRAELATLPWLLLVLLHICAGAFKLGVVREEPFAKFFKLCPGPLEMQDVKLHISQISAFEIYVERLKESPREAARRGLKLLTKGGKSATKVILFSYAGWNFSVLACNGFLGGSAHVAIKCNGFWSVQSRMWKFFWWLLMVGGLLWGCSLFSSAFFLGFFVFFWQRCIGLPGLFSAFGLASLASCCGRTTISWSGLFDYRQELLWSHWSKLFQLFNAVVVLAILSWLFRHAIWCSADMTMVVLILWGCCSLVRWCGLWSAALAGLMMSGSSFASSRIVPFG